MSGGYENVPTDDIHMNQVTSQFSYSLKKNQIFLCKFSRARKNFRPVVPPGQLDFLAGQVTFKACLSNDRRWEGGWGGSGVLGLIFVGYLPLASRSLYPIIVYSVANYRAYLSHFWANMLFSRSQLNHFLFLSIDPFFKWNEEHFIFHLQYKHSNTFANRKYEELSYPKTSENVQPHSSNSIENATPL